MSDATGDTRGYLPEIYRRLREDQPAVLAAYGRLAEACSAAGPLSSAEQRLVKLGIAIGLGSEGAVRSHARRALDEGVSAEAILHAIVLAVPTAGFPATVAAYGWASEVLGHREETA